MAQKTGKNNKKNKDMHTQQKENSERLDFESFIRKFIPEYKFDQFNQKLIRQIGLWATRNEKFNNMEDGWHIDRGLLISGVPGVGKDEIFYILRRYLSYLGAINGYGHRVVLDYAKEFMRDKVGYACFDNDKGNLYYEELARTDERTGEVTREYVQHYGNKLLIGEEIIHIRCKQFKERGWQTHFSTNCTEEQLHAIYGERAMDRLYEMCNIMILTGVSKRGKVSPAFQRNENIPQPPKARETTIDEHMENRRILEQEYKMYCEKGVTSETVSLNFNLLKVYGCDVISDEDMRKIIEEVEPTFIEDAGLKRVSQSDREKNKSHYVWQTARKKAVELFYQRLKHAGAKSIFNEVEVDLDKAANSIISTEKDKK